MDDEWKADRWQRSWLGYRLTVKRLDVRKYEWTLCWHEDACLRIDQVCSLTAALVDVELAARRHAQAQGVVPSGDFTNSPLDPVDVG